MFASLLLVSFAGATVAVADIMVAEVVDMVAAEAVRLGRSRSVFYLF